MCDISETFPLKSYLNIITVFLICHQCYQIDREYGNTVGIKYYLITNTFAK